MAVYPLLATLRIHCYLTKDKALGMAMEDAASLAVMLSDVAIADEIPDRLKLYNDTRYSRANMIQEFSYLVGQDEKDRTGRVDMTKFTFLNFGHDEFNFSAQKLREWHWSRSTPQWRQPTAFGPTPGPRQNFLGVPRNGSGSTRVTALVKFKTSRTSLETFFPPGSKGLSFQNPGTVAYASISVTTFDKLEWLGGSGYNSCALSTHGVQYTNKDGNVVKGSYLPVMFEDLADAVVSGRGGLGMPKLFSGIDMHRREKAYFATTS